MVAKHGQRYHCLLPDSELDWNSLLDFTSEGERISIPDLLQPLQDQCLLTVRQYNAIIYLNMHTYFGGL